MTNLTPTLENELEYIKARARYSSYDPAQGSGREYIWQDDAACASVDPDLFQMSSTGDPGAEELRNQALTKYNQEKIETAQRICAGCPVRKECLADATPSDLHWSVRGGEVPKRHLLRGGKKVAPSAEIQPYLPAWECEKHGSESIRWRKAKAGQRGNTRPFCGVCADIKKGKRVD